MMKAIRQLMPAASIALGILAVAGCGGGGGSAAGGTSTMGVYVTDAFDDQFSQVWVTLFKVEASADGTTFQTLFEDSAGRTLNISRLRNAAEFLGAVSLSQTSFTKVRVTIADHVLLVPKAGGAGQSVPVDNSIPTAGGKSVITFDVTSSASHRDMVVDFDLAAFELISGKLRPKVRRGDDNAFQRSEKRAEVEGTVANLGASGFDLNLRGGSVVKVQFYANTVIVQKRTGASATLANGQRVEVKGGVDATSRTVLATRIRVDTRNGDDDNRPGDPQLGAEAEGTVASVNKAEKSFTVTLREAENFRPASGTVTVKTDASTVFDRRRQDFASFDDVVAGRQVEALGDYDSATNTLRAKRVEIK